jgi:hypothetical protein
MNVDWTHQDSGERGHTTVHSSVNDRYHVTLHGLEGYDFSFNLRDLGEDAGLDYIAIPARRERTTGLYD